MLATLPIAHHSVFKNQKIYLLSKKPINVFIPHPPYPTPHKYVPPWEVPTVFHSKPLLSPFSDPSHSYPQLLLSYSNQPNISLCCRLLIDDSLGFSFPSPNFQISLKQMDWWLSGKTYRTREIGLTETMCCSPVILRRVGRSLPNSRRPGDCSHQVFWKEGRNDDRI